LESDNAGIKDSLVSLETRVEKLEKGVI
jgi:hypothetical protein